MKMRTRLQIAGALWLGLLLAARPSIAQPEEVAPAHASADDVFHWLHSGDSRMLAWAAYFTARNDNRVALLDLQRLAEEWRPLPRKSAEENERYEPRPQVDQDRAEAMAAVLDTLVQMHGSVQPEALSNLVNDFPGATVTLFGDLPEGKRLEAAQAIYQARLPEDAYTFPAGNYGTGGLVHAAVAVLALEPPAGFAASLLNGTHVQLAISVRSPGQQRVWGFGCGSGIGRGIASPRVGWPPYFGYFLEEMPPEDVHLAQGARLLIGAQLVVTTQRTAGMDSGLGPVSDYFRAGKIAQMAGVAREQLGWTTGDRADIVFESASGYRASFAEALVREEDAFAQTSATLSRRGVLTAYEAETARPFLSVRVHDGRQTKEADLPRVTPAVAKIVVEPEPNPEL